MIKKKKEEGSLPEEVRYGQKGKIHYREKKSDSGKKRSGAPLKRVFLLTGPKELGEDAKDAERRRGAKVKEGGKPFLSVALENQSSDKHPASNKGECWLFFFHVTRGKVHANLKKWREKDARMDGNGGETEREGRR